MYFPLVYAPEFFAVPYGRKSLHKLFPTSDRTYLPEGPRGRWELYISPICLPFIPLSHGNNTFLGGASYEVYSGPLSGVKDPSVYRAQTLTLSTCEHERN